jgi:hypothetical protein
MSLFSIGRSPTNHFKAGSWAASLLGCALIFPQLSAAAEGPFGRFAGSWSGRGHVVTSDGKSEAISCRATYDISQGGASLTQALVCASDSYRFDIHSTVVADGRSAQGSWQETTRGVQGSLAGTIENGVFQGNVTGPGFTATISLQSTGRRQAVEIVPQGTSIAKVEVALARVAH